MSKEELLKYLIAEIDLIMHDKDYRFENANGTWYSRESCRDLTNEEVFEELRTELRQFADLEAKLAEYEKFMKDNEWDSVEEMQETLNKCEKKYFDIQKQLAESENQCRECKHLNKKIELNIKNKLMAENCELQKQLAEKEKEIDILKTALGQASIEAFGKKESFVSSNYPKKIANANEYMEFLIYIASKEKENGNKK